MKNKTWKKILSGLCVFCMMFLMIAQAVTAFAAEISAEEAYQSSGVFTATSDSGVSVEVSVPEDAFDEPVTMSVCDVVLDDVTKTRVLSAANGDNVISSVDITFYNAAGNPMEPSAQLTVSITADMNQQADKLTIVHVDTLEDGAVDFDIEPQQLASRSTGYDTLTTQTDDFSIFAVVDSPALLYYSFFDNDGNLVSEQTVKEGEILYEPNVPKTLDNKAFVGWFEKGSDKPFTDFGKVGEVTKSETLNLTARYSSETAHVIYYDTKGLVVRTDIVPINTEITIQPDSPSIVLDSLTTCLCGWSDVPHGADVSGKYLVGTEDVKLYPILLEGWWATFKSNGGTSVDSQFIKSVSTGDECKVKKPYDPYREGYTFAGWYADQALTVPFDFDKPIYAATTIYAKWAPKDNTVYKVNYWIEYQSDIENDKWDYKILARKVNQGTTGAKTEYDPNLILNHPYRKEDYGYLLNKEKSETKTIAPDGTTVVNVYYDCQTRNISVTFPNREGNDVTVSKDNVKFSADMKFFWDEVAKYNDLDFLFDGHHEFLFSPNSISLSNPGNLSRMPFYSDEKGIWRAVEFNLARRTFYETLEGVAPDGKEVVNNTSARIKGGYNTDDRLYYESDRGYLYGGANKGVVPGEPIGFKCFFYGSDGNFGWSTANVKTIWYHNTNGWGLDNKTNTRDTSDKSIFYEYDNDPDGFMDIYYIRQKYKLNFHENGGETLEDQEVYYEKNISVFDPAVTHPYQYTPGASIRQNPDGQVLLFDGWYTDFTLTDPFEGFDLAMPAYDIDLYAKWKPITYTVTFDSNGGSYVPPVKGIVYNQKVIEPEEPTYGGYKFLNWTLDGKVFSFESGITRDITLVAQWNSDNAYPVIYDLNGGTGTTPEDDNSYYANVRASVLPPESDVKGPDGKVFLGWVADSDGQLYYPNSSVKMPKATLTLTAQWGEKDDPTDFTYDFNYKTYKITSYHTSATEQTITTLANNSEITTADFSYFGQTPDGYSFLGWNLKADGSDRMIMPGDKLWVDKDDTTPNRIYAIWKSEAKPDKTSVHVMKKWIGPAAKSVKVELYADDAKVADIVLNKDNNWEYTFTDLEKQKDGVEIKYTVKEIVEGAYSSKITGNMKDGFVITNTNTETIDIPVEKKWVGQAAKAVTINLLADGKKISTVELNANKDWKHIFTDLSKYDSKDGHEIEYTITEDSISGYKTTISGDMKQGFVVTNTNITPPPSDTPKTSDESHTMLYLLITLLSGAGLVFVFLFGRKSFFKAR